MGDDNTIHASDYNCCVCGKPAVAFWPVIDPDITSRPYCRACLDGVNNKLIIELYKQNKSFKKK